MVKSNSRSRGVICSLDKKPDFKNNLYYVKKGTVMKYNKKSGTKTSIQKVPTVKGHLYYVDGKGNVNERKLKHFRH